MHTPTFVTFTNQFFGKQVTFPFVLCTIAWTLCFPYFTQASESSVSRKPSFQQTQPGYRYTFPFDHGSHDVYVTEWWYFTGHVFSQNGHRFGYELTFFRRAIDDERAWRNPSQWALRQFYLAHFALTDERSNAFRYAEKISREGLGKAGAKEGTLETWIDQWSIKTIDHHQFRLQAKTKSFAIDFLTDSQKPPVIHGRQGMSQKGSQVGHASHYYSLTRLHTTGTLRINGETYDVKGQSWMDHEFSSSDLEDGLVGWDWFSIQLESGHDLMIYWLRRKDGTFSPFSSGTLVYPDGSSQHLSRQDLHMTILDHWTSSQSGARYPSQWTLKIAPHDIRLHITPRMANQELRTGRSTQVTYWERAVDVTGTFQHNQATGMGYVELTGYAKPYEPRS